MINTEKIIKIKNKFLEKHIAIEEGKISKLTFINKLKGVFFLPKVGSSLFIISILQNDNTYININSNDLFIKNIKKNSKEIIFTFNEINILNNILTIKLHYNIDKSKHYIRSFITISSNNPKDITISHITFNHFHLNDYDKTWSRPNMAKAYMPEYHTRLGEPVYINSLFFGIEFPICDNNIENNISHLTYYQGKTLDKMSNGKNFYKSYNSVFGAGYGIENNLIKKAFFEYISNIATTPKLRIQFNSWYDFMTDISDEKMKTAFFEVEHGLSNAGVKPIASYVVDDGYSDYDKDFWNFSEKFPNELHNVSKIARLLGSQFGLWLGPRGGYGHYTSEFAKRMETAGKGGYNKEANDICIGDYNYLKNVKKFILDATDKFKLNYWKLDGFVLYPCKSDKHGHPVGGPNDMYSFTDTWENWRNIFKALHEKGVYINQTSYSNISPWHMDYANSLWIQNSHDVGFIDKAPDGTPLGGTDADRMLTYRDNCYYDFTKVREYQFPTTYLYNHDPIYGNGAEIKMDKENFRKYLLMHTTRGNGFWEMYFSYNIMDDNFWAIASDIYLFLETNFEILKHSLLFGGCPAKGETYGFLAETDDAFIISVRNPSNQKRDYTLSLDSSIGITNDFKNYLCSQIFPYSLTNNTYSHGDKINIVLNPHDVFIYKFSKAKHINKQDKLDLIAIKDFGNKLEIRFNQRVYLKDSYITLNGNNFPFVIKDNYRDIVIDINELPESNTLTLTAYDIYNREYKINKEFNKSDLLFNSEFSLSFTLNNINDNTTIYKDKSFELSYINNKFNVRLGQDLISHKANNNDNIFIVRERNGLIKLYISGELVNSKYNKTILSFNINLQQLKESSLIKDLHQTNISTIYNKISKK